MAEKNAFKYFKEVRQDKLKKITSWNQLFHQFFE